MINKDRKRMRLRSIRVSVAILLLCIAIGALGVVHADDLEISSPPVEWTTPYGNGIYNYGDVVLTESKTVTFRMDSIGSSEVSVYILWLIDTSPYVYPDPYASPPDLNCWESFCFNPDTYPILPAILPPGDYLLVDVTFTPLELGEQSVYLHFRSNDAYPEPGSVAYIKLVGNGVSGPGPGEQIDDVQEFFDDSVASGELAGAGPTRTAAAGNLQALENMLERAEYLINIDDTEGVCRQLHDAYKKMDGLPRPPDFVAGPAADDLATMIQDLMDSLGCA